MCPPSGRRFLVGSPVAAAAGLACSVRGQSAGAAGTARRSACPGRFDLIACTGRRVGPWADEWQVRAAGTVGAYGSARDADAAARTKPLCVRWPQARLLLCRNKDAPPVGKWRSEAVTEPAS